jgi:hypothetical protein
MKGRGYVSKRGTGNKGYWKDLELIEDEPMPYGRGRPKDEIV